MIGFVVHERKINFLTEKPRWTGDGGCSVSALLIERAELWKLLFQLCSHKDKEAYMIKEAAGYGKEKRAKSQFFLKTTL